MNEEQTTIVANLLAKLKGLGVGFIKPVGIIDGPVVTGFRFEVPDHIPVSKIFAKQEDLEMAVQLPEGEKFQIKRMGGELVFFIPNRERKIVDFKDCLWKYLKDEDLATYQLPLMLGVDVYGNYAYLDLADMPHILVAGSTGAGKSVFESSLVASLATRFSPEQLSLYLVDTKRVDLTQFSTHPSVSLMARTVEEWYKTYNHLLREVERRLKELEGVGVRNIKEFNQISPYRWEYRILIIDELADLIERDKAYKEEHPDSDEPKVIDAIKRIIGICRATGLHIIACTQRTDVKVVSGTVKANFPARISLRLPTGTDSRTILDQQGAENLLGKGDMLIKKPDNDNLERYHGPFVKLSDISEILLMRNELRSLAGL